LGSGAADVGGSRATPIPRDDLPPRGPRILVVDDDPAHLGHALEMLARHGLTPIVAGDGAEAVALASGYDFDLILMDLVLPVLDGLEATRQIRRHEREQNSVRAPVLAYTSLLPEAGLLAPAVSMASSKSRAATAHCGNA
jgi:CheY-like chemotaxis protein